MTDAPTPNHAGDALLVAHTLSDVAEADRVLVVVRPVPRGDLDELLSACTMIDELTLDNPYFALQRTMTAWVDTLDRCRRRGVHGFTWEDEGLLRHEVPAAATAVLHAFRTFVDQTQRWAKARLGPDGLVAVKDQTRTEYDRSVAYRLASNLRNTATHRRSVFAVSTRSSKATTGEEVTVRISRGAADARWQPRVLREFEAMSDEMSVETMLVDLMACCERIVSRLLIEASECSGEAVRLVVAVTDEARDASDDPHASTSLMFGAVPDGKKGNTRGELSFRQVRRDMADSLAGMSDAALRLLSEDAHDGLGDTGDGTENG